MLQNRLPWEQKNRSFSGSVGSYEGSNLETRLHLGFLSKAKMFAIIVIKAKGYFLLNRDIAFPQIFMTCPNR